MNIVKWDFESSEVRTVVIDGEPWWIARDVCNVLGVMNAPQAVQILDTDEKLVYVLYISGQNREVNLINESGLYALILRSNKREAKVFRKWVTSVVLPQIRKTGSFHPSEISRKELALMVVRAEEELEKANLLIAEQQPKVDLAEKCLTAINLLTMNDVAKTLGYGRNTLFQVLREKKVLMKNNSPYQEYVDRGLFEVKIKTITMGSDNINKSQTFVTAKGVDYIRKVVI